MASVYKPKGSRRYVVAYYDENGRRRKATGCADKAESERIGDHLERQARLRKEGLLDPQAEAYRDHESVPLAKHLDAYLAYLTAKGSTPNYVKAVATRARRILDLGGLKRISDLCLSRVLGVLQGLRKEGLMRDRQPSRPSRPRIRTMAPDGSTVPENLLEGLSTKSSDHDRRRVRRALTPDEASSLISDADAVRSS